MNVALQNLKTELEQFGHANDSEHTELAQRMLNITRDTGEFLAVLVLAMQARRVLEIGTSNGYSTLWLAEACEQTSGVVTTLESADHKVAMAAENFGRAGLDGKINLVHDDAGRFLADAHPATYDLLFLDSERSHYVTWWPHLNRVLRPGGLLVVDNAISHAQEMGAFSTLIQADPAFISSLVPVGKGELLAVKRQE